MPDSIDEVLYTKENIDSIRHSYLTPRKNVLGWEKTQQI
jgi:hypothetical protein